MTSFIRASSDSKTSVKYTPCSKDDQTTDEELDEIAVVVPGENAEKTESEDELANGPRLLPSRDPSNYPTDKVRLIRSDHTESTGTVHRSSPAYSISKTPEKHIRHRADSRQSLMDVMSHKIEKLSKHRPTVYGQEIAILNKTRSTDLLTPREIRKLRRKEIEEKFGKKALRQHKDNEIEQADGCRWTFVFDPSGRLSYWWSFVVSVAFIYNFWVIIYRFAFAEINSSNLVVWFTLDYLADLLYAMDIAFHFRTAFIEEGVLQTDGTRLRIHYMNTTKFYVDLLCLLPLDFLYLSVGFNSIFRCFRLVKIYRYWAFLDRTERHTNYPNMVRTATLMHYLFCIFHWNACLHYMVAFKLQKSPLWAYENTTDTYYVNYIKGLYYSTCALTTVGDLPRPQTPGEYAFIVVQVCVGFLLFAAVLGHIANIVASISAARKDFQAKLDGVKTYMMLRRVPLHLQERVIKWFDYLWMSHKTTDEEKSLSLLPDKLKAEIAIHVHLDTLKRVEIFQSTDPGFLHELVLRLRPVLFSPGDYICRKGEVGKEMYIVNRGRLQVVADNGKHVLATLKPGSYFGEISILNMGTEGNRRTASVRSVGYSDLFCLSKTDMWDVLKEYPTARVKLEAIAVKRLAKYKKVPLEKASLPRSKSTPGLVESSGKVPLEQMHMSSDYLATCTRARSERHSYSDTSGHSGHSACSAEPESKLQHDDYPTDNQAYALTPPASPSVCAYSSQVPTIGVSPPNHHSATIGGQPQIVQLQAYGAPPPPTPLSTTNSLVPASMQLLTPSYGVMIPSYRSGSGNLISPIYSPRTPRHHLHGESAVVSAPIASGSTGSLVRDPSSDILLQEISRLRLRLNSLETENASMSIKLNQQQWEVEQRLSEIEMQMCGSESGGSASDDGKGNKESAI